MKSRESLDLALSPAKRTPGRAIVYLASPYSHPNPDIRLHRFEQVTEAAARLIESGIIVFSPITMTHPIDLIIASDNKTMGSDYWTSFDEAFMYFCSELQILTLEGWNDSSGIRREISHFSINKKPIYLLDQYTFEKTIFQNSN